MRFLIFLYFLCSVIVPAMGQSGTARAFKLLKSGKFQEAIDYNLDRIERNKNPVKYHHILARAYALLGNDVQSEKEYQKALEFVIQKSKHKKMRLSDFDILDELSLLNVRTGNWQEAKRLANQSLQLRVKWWSRKNPTNFRPYLTLGMLHFKQGSFDSARYYLNTYRRSLKNSNYTGHLDVDKYADVFQVLAEISLNENNLDEAHQLARRSLRLQRHEWTRRMAGKNYSDRIKALNILTSIYLRNEEYRKAEKTNRRAVQMQEQYSGKDELLQVDVILNKAFLTHRKNNIKDCKSLLTKAMRLQMDFVNKTMIYLSEYEKENIYAQFKANSNRIISQAYTLYEQEQIDLNDSFWSDMLNYVINTKAIILSETNKIIEGSTSLGNDSLLYLLGDWKQLKRKWYYLTSVSKRINRKKINKGKANREEIEKIHQSIVNTEKRLGNLIKPRSMVNWKSICEQLSENEMAMEMVKVNKGDTAQSFLTFKLTNQADFPELVSLDGNEEIDRYITSYFNAIKYDIEDTLMHPTVWQPLQVPNHIERIYLSPSGIFHLVNFNTIKKPHGGYLADELAIVNVTNIANLINIGSREVKFESAMLIGISDFSFYQRSLDIPDLPGAESEVHHIDSLLRRNGLATLSVLNKEATKKTIEEVESYSILHLATHGFFNTRSTNPMLDAGLILAKKNEFDNGILTAYEASLLNLEKTGLVVLSSCSSGLGSVRDGEGIYGLQRAFEAAGVDNIITSTWNIDDDFTQYFMLTFYKNLIQMNQVSMAFTNTLREAKKRNPNPRLWGAFKLVQNY